MEEAYFNQLRAEYSAAHNGVSSGKMMNSESIVFHGKVFVFFSRKKKMVFKLGKDFRPEDPSEEMQVFNPFKKRGPLNGWYEVSYARKELWEELLEQAFALIKRETRS